MIVVGGTYLERCRYPRRDHIMGSGARAACALAGMNCEVHLRSAIDGKTREAANVTLGGFDLRFEWVDRSEPIGFNYFTPLSSPSIDGRLSTAKPIVVNNAECALVFGMIESSAKIKATHLVYDPQQPRDLVELDLTNTSANHFALVANRTETIGLSGSRNIKEGARLLRERYHADVVISKQGARGALVTTDKYQTEVGAHPTETVMPIGSGDAFAAGFAWAWAERKFDPVESAMLGSAAAATYVSTEALPFREDALVAREGLSGALAPRDARIYLAGPFFSLAQHWLVDMLFGAFELLGAAVFSPYHHIGVGGDEVAEQDLRALQECDAVLAILDDLDSGTLFEVGWAIRAGKPVVGFVSSTKLTALKMLRGSGVELCDDLSTAVYRSIWRAMGAPASC